MVYKNCHNKQFVTIFVVTINGKHCIAIRADVVSKKHPNAFLDTLCSVENGGQRRLLFEQRSTAYVWGISDSATSVSAASTDMGSIASEEVQGLSRSRLSGLKQISVAGLANLRQRISDGRKLMLDRSRGGATPNHRSTNFNSAPPNVEVAEEAVEHPTEDNQSKLPKPESLKPKVGDAR